MMDFKQQMKEDPGADALGMESFMITEDFSAIFNEASAVYARLAFKEGKKSNADIEKIMKWKQRSQELGILRNYYTDKDLITMRATTEMYVGELKQAEELEAEMYDR